MSASLQRIQPHDDPQPHSDDCQCSDCIGDYVSVCDVCGTGVQYELEEGICRDCSIQWLASHQIGCSNGQKQLHSSVTDVRFPAVAERPLSFNAMNTALDAVYGALDRTEATTDYFDHTMFYESPEAKQREREWKEKQARIWAESQPTPEEFK